MGTDSGVHIIDLYALLLGEIPAHMLVLGVSDGVCGDIAVKGEESFIGIGNLLTGKMLLKTLHHVGTGEITGGTDIQLYPGNAAGNNLVLGMVLEIFSIIVLCMVFTYLI